MATYFKLEPEQASEICKNFNLPDPVEFHEISGGLANTNYSVSFDPAEKITRVCVKVVNEKSREDLNTQIQAISLLKKHQYPTCYCFETRERECIYALSNGKLVLVFDYLEGKVGDADTISEKSSIELGIALAKLHKIDPRGIKLPPFPTGLAAIDPFLESCKGTKWDEHEFVIFLKDELNTLRPVLAEKFPQGMLHGDLFPDNAIFLEDGALSGVIDFEEVIKYRYNENEGYFLTFLFLAFQSKGVASHLVRALYEVLISALTHSDHGAKLVKAYNDQRSLLDIEWKYLPQLLEYAALTIAYWRFKQFNCKYEGHPLKDHYEQYYYRAKFFKMTGQVFVDYTQDFIKTGPISEDFEPPRMVRFHHAKDEEERRKKAQASRPHIENADDSRPIDILSDNG